MRSLTLWLVSVYSSVWGLGNFTSSYSSYRDVAFLNHHFYLSGFKIGKHRLDVEIIRTDRENRVFNQLIKDSGYNLKFYFNPLPFLSFNLVSNGGLNRYQAGAYLLKTENSLLAGELILQNQNFYFRNSLGQRIFKALDIPGSGIEEEHELKGQFGNVLFIGGLTNYSLAQSMNRRAYFGIEPVQEISWEKLRLGFTVNGETNRESYPLAQNLEDKNLAGLAGSVKLQYPIFNIGSINFEEATSFSNARYRLITSNDIASNNRRLRTGLHLNPSAHTELKLNLERSYTLEAKMVGRGDENRDKKLFNALFNYQYRRGHLSFKRSLSLETVVTPYALNKNDRDILTDRMNLDFQLNVRNNLSSRLQFSSSSEDLIYVERFMSGNTRTTRFYNLDGEVDWGLSPVRFIANLSSKFDYLFFRFSSRRNSYSQIQDYSLTTIYEDNPILLPKLTVGAIWEDYFSHEEGRYALSLGVLRKQLGVSILYLPTQHLSLTPSFELSQNENYNPYTQGRLPWWDKTGGISINWKPGNQSELVGDIKNVRRSYGEENWLVNISINYRF